MSLTIDGLKRLLTAQQINFTAHPERPALIADFTGENGRYEVLFDIELDGAFLQLRTVNWLHCPVEHASLPAVLRVLGEVNYERRFVKLGWDPSDGELVAFGDVWIEDGTLTAAQFSRLLSIYLLVVDSAYGRLHTTFETGKDPGDTPLKDTFGGERTGPEAHPSGGDVGDKVRKLLEQLRGAAPSGSKPGEAPEDEYV